MDKFLKGMQLRHACKIFDENKKIDSVDFENILKVGLNAPSSFGLEPTRIIVVQNPKARAEIKPLCWDQVQITTASELVIFKTLKTDLLAHTNYVKNSFGRRTKTKEAQEKYIQIYANYLKNRGYDEYTIGYWTALQSYITATSMMDYASYLGIDTCMIEGFEKNDIEKYLKIDQMSEQVTLLLAFGYRVKEQYKRNRIDINEFVKIIK